MFPKKLKFTLILLSGLALLLILAPSVSAANTFLPECISTGYCTLCDIMQTFINFGKFLLGIVGSLALLMFVYGGFVWLTSGGESGKIDQGKKILINSVIGVAITFFAWVVVAFVVSTLTAGNPSFKWDADLACAPLPGLEPVKISLEPQLGIEGATCAKSTECNSDLYCDSTGKCRKKLPLGAACHADETTKTIESTINTSYQALGTLSSYACIKGECKHSWIPNETRYSDSGICLLALESGDVGDFCTSSNQCKGFKRKDHTLGPALFCKCKVKRTGTTGCGGDGTATCQTKNVFGEECVGWTRSANVLLDVDGDAYACLSLRCSNTKGCLEKDTSIF